MKVKMCRHIDISKLQMEMSQDIFTICTIDETRFVTHSCNECYNEMKELEHEIISKQEFEKYLI
ncbi:MAG TPA: hypothetical protein HA347_05765 [Nitrosopumilus sp.]|jgi:hypothetical protein|nr:MAG: hypothetical protein ABR53_06455 [Nitrosopumilus sp. BACL13 MAG-121220-bin23]HIH99876.1 hypothetical protein [Nitrosopumilus sp.]HII05460.1 hypothetical protein [Nitrosopumilus sp.]